jgi:hypothetical protein
VDPGHTFDGQRVWLARRDDGHAYFDRNEGLVQVTWLAGQLHAESKRQVLGRGEPGARFARDTEVAARAWSTKGAVVLVDPSDGTAWEYRHDPYEASLARLELPDDDRVRVHRVNADGTILFEGARGFYRYQSDERGGAAMRIEGDEQAEYVAKRGKAVAQREALERLLAEVSDPIEYDVTVEAQSQPGGVFRHSYAPRSPGERRAARAALAAALLRPPVALVAHHLRPLPEPAHRRLTVERAILLDPLVAGGKRPWLVLAAFLISSGLALVVVLRLRRMQAELRRVIGWALVVLTFGPIGLSVHFALESSRAWRWVRATFLEPVPAPLIQSR